MGNLETMSIHPVNTHQWNNLIYCSGDLFCFWYPGGNAGLNTPMVSSSSPSSSCLLNPGGSAGPITDGLMMLMQKLLKIQPWDKTSLLVLEDWLWKHFHTCKQFIGKCIVPFRWFVLMCISWGKSWTEETISIIILFSLLCIHFLLLKAHAADKGVHKVTNNSNH